ncbi:hypothetical protein AB0O90_07195 [Microbacterium testaceum]|uniref:hypothetical protein n=1 Tax=Microbacterium testaceum TaxID=2033 RepID=UPI00342AD44D
MLLSVAVFGMCVLVGAGVIAVILPRLEAPAPLSDFLRLAAISGVLAIGAAALYVIRYNGGDLIALVGADVAMVLSPAVLALAVTPRRRRRLPTIVVVVLALVVAVCSAVLPGVVSMQIKVAAVALVCGAAGVGSLRAPMLPRRTVRLLSAAMLSYAVYSSLRLLASLAGGPPSPLLSAAFGSTATATAGIATVTLIVVGLALIRSPSAVSDSAGCVRNLVVICEWEEARKTYGVDQLSAIVAELRLAAREVDPSSVDAWHGVETNSSTSLSMIRRHLSQAYGWRGQDLALLCDDPPRGLRRRPSADHRDRVHPRADPD